MSKTTELATADKERAGLFLLDQVMSFTYPAALRAAAIIGVADHMVDGPKTPQELAKATSTDPQKLYRVLRLLATRGVFREDDQGRFELTPNAELLRKDVPLSVRKAVTMLTSKAIWVAANDLADSLRGDDPSFEKIFGTKIWEYWSRDLAPEEDFHQGMSSMSGPEIQSPVRTYDFPQNATVADVGGGIGTLLLSVLQHNPTVRGILFDQEHVLSNHRLGELGEDSRWELASGDFFEKVPPADLYVLKYITHDWNDEQVVRILSRCRESMAPGGRVLIFDTVIPSGNEPHTGKIMDLILMAIYPGRERTEEDFRDLLAEAGLRLNRVIDTDSYISIVEAVAA